MSVFVNQEKAIVKTLIQNEKRRIGWPRSAVYQPIAQSAGQLWKLCPQCWQDMMAQILAAVNPERG
jgi:hypothetical protein